MPRSQCLVAERGAIPILLARRADKLAEVGLRITGEKGLYTVDVTNNEQVTAAVEEIIEKYGKIDVWINNAGFGHCSRMCWICPWIGLNS